MKTVKENITNQIEIKKSIFITNLFYVENEEDVNKYLNEVKKKFYDAKHNCYAYIYGFKNLSCKQSDDNEPRGTAGLPILNSIKSKEITNCLIIVTRYFGGILLGANGLFRAYSDSANLILEKSDKSEILSGNQIILEVNYHDYQVLTNFVMSSNDKIMQLKTDFNENVRISYLVDDSITDEFLKYIKYITSDKAKTEMNKKIIYAKFDTGIKYIMNI